MQSSSAFCRAQVELHTKRAAESNLANVKAVATAAATAWRAEAALAEQREKRHLKRDAETASENPDRGLSEQIG